jgi:hypothetical protein
MPNQEVRLQFSFGWRMGESFSDQRSHLQQQWEQSDSASTEDLRLALRRYRSFFDRLLSINLNG